MAVNRQTFVAFELSLLLSSLCAQSSLILSGGNITMTFDDVEAHFAPPIKSSVHGAIYTSEPLDACSNVTTADISKPSFLLIVRGGCSFDIKVEFAQIAGYNAAIIYDDVEEPLIAMAGKSTGVRINAVFVSKKSGETLKRYSSSSDYELWIVPNYENSAWSIMAITIISLLAMSAILATCFFVRTHRVRRPRTVTRPPVPRPQEFRRMSSRSVKCLPSLVFTTVQEDNCTSMTCAICLEDYVTGDKLRILPCRHKFHALCIDCWLTSWRTFCPVCKRDAKDGNGTPPASESTPLLTPTPSPFVSSPISSPLSVGLTISRPPRSSRPQRSPFINGSVGIASMSSQRTLNSYLVSPRSFGYPSVSSLGSSYMPYVASASNPTILPRGESATSLDRFGSAYSLPEGNAGF